MTETLVTKSPRKLKQKSVFLTLFGVSFAAFALGFGDCLFDIDNASACVAHAEGWVDDFKGVGDHLIAWIIAIFEAAFK